MTEWRFAVALITLLAASGAPLAAQVAPKASTAVPLAQRIARADPSKYQHLSGVHDGAGSMDFRVMLGTDALDTNLIFFHRGVILPRSSIGEHFHNQCEEMFVILDGEAQFTVDGHTSLIQGPAAVPDRIGHAHAIYNATDKPVQWLNINVGYTKTYDAFNLGDPRADVPLEPVPQFISTRLDRSLLKPVERMNGGAGAVQYRRALQPSVFYTTWSYIDHLVIPAGSSVGPIRKADISEVYYVIAGDGNVTIGSETAAIHSGDVVPVRLNESQSIANAAGGPLELMVVGVARDMAAKKALMTLPQGN